MFLNGLKGPIKIRNQVRYENLKQQVEVNPLKDKSHYNLKKLEKKVIEITQKGISPWLISSSIASLNASPRIVRLLSDSM